MDVAKSLYIPIKGKSDIGHNIFDIEGNDQKSSMSPVTELAFTMEQSSMSTPRRKLSLCSSNGIATPRCVSNGSFLDQDCSSPLPECPDFDSPTTEHLRIRRLSGNNSSNDFRKMIARKSISSPSLPKLQMEPLNFSDSSSLNGSLSLGELENKDLSLNDDLSKLENLTNNNENTEEKHSDLSLCEMSDEFSTELKDTEFLIRKRSTRRSNSAPVLVMSNDFVSIDFKQLQNGKQNTESNDGFEFFNEFSSQENGPMLSSSVPSDIMKLIDAPFLSSQNDNGLDKENVRPRKKILSFSKDGDFRKPKVPPLKSRSASLSVKREKPDCESSPGIASRKKRPKFCRSQSFYDTDPALSQFCMQRPTPTRSLQRSQSFDAQMIKSPSIGITSLFDIDEKKLIGDKSKEYCLPVTDCKHPDLRGISAETLADLIEGKYNHVVDEYFIIDCRYPYEYEGGHIKDAMNIYEKGQTIQEFLKKPRNGPNKRQVFVFHCEFSSKRGPGMSRFLRNKDRELHQHCYPHLYYPEMYLLEGGYKEFFEKKKELCVPQEYREMADPNFAQELKFFNKRSKSWSEGATTLRQKHRTGLRY